MFESQGGKFSLVFGTSKDKRNQVTLFHAGNLKERKLLTHVCVIQKTPCGIGLKYYLTAYHGTFCQEENPLPSPADSGSSE